MSFRRLFYTLLLYLIFPFVILKLYWRSLSSPAYRQRIHERLGLVKLDTKKAVIWVHAVSVGETIAAKPLIESLIKKYPDYQVLVTTTTPTGSERVISLFGERVAHVYYPYDLPEIIQRFLKRVKPKILIVVETEIWPNLYAACNKRQIPIVIVNARLSEKSSRAYLKIKALVAETLSYVNTIAVRSKADAQRFSEIGANSKIIRVTGNIKFDLKLDQQQIKKGRERRQQWGKERNVWVAASTHDKEDEQILQIYKKLLSVHPELLLIIVPRHPERFDKVYALCQEFYTDANKGNVLRHSGIKSYQNTHANIIIGDSMGEMQSWFAASDVAFIGGSLVNVGGHNPLEAIAQGIPVTSGPYMFNFEDISSELAQSGLLFICQNQQQIEHRIKQLLARDKTDLQHKAEAIMQQQGGVSERLMSIISKQLTV